MDGYLELLRRRFGTKRVNCNIVYQEYIAFREHIHMNSTQWETLTEFIKWLGREGTEIISVKSFHWENSFYFYEEIKLFNIQSIQYLPVYNVRKIKMHPILKIFNTIQFVVKHIKVKTSFFFKHMIMASFSMN